MRANSRIRINNGRLRQLTQASIRVLEQTAEVLHTEEVQAQVMPFDTGTMQNARTAVVQDVLPDTVHTALVTDTPYARRLYHHPEYHFQTGKNANARGEWLHDWLPGGAQEHWLQTTYESALKRRLPK